uniref:Dynein axonemal intermediate chain 4 n=2 Tax=Micromonas pusilla TaxID=38833 RepID=A0A6U0KVF9_MICPS|mmetsp:Transcript_8074/g.29569  ORF Transcript_8074/g.29569 Transcript_8074/m.29569 type:complete len:670 (+) Transcript_8074:238-2247(+)
MTVDFRHSHEGLGCDFSPVNNTTKLLHRDKGFFRQSPGCEVVTKSNTNHSHFIPDSFQRLQFFDDDGVNVTPRALLRKSNMVKNSTVQEFSKSLCLISASENSEVASSETTQISPDDKSQNELSKSSFFLRKASETRISLFESENLCFFSLLGNCILRENPSGSTALHHSSAHEARHASELRTDVQTQTVTVFTTSKEAQHVSGVCTTQQCQADVWIMQESMLEYRLNGTDQVFSKHIINLGDSIAGNLAMGTCSFITHSSQLYTALKMLEKVILQNVYHEKLLSYRDYNFSKDTEQELIHLWNFECALTDERNVSCMTWNKIKPDILAVGYGESNFTLQRAGLVAFWSLENPESPEWTLSTHVGVTAMAFSSLDFNLLAVGLYDGTVSIYDVRSPADEAILESGHGTPGKHSDPVWKLCWTTHESDQEETITSISTDGRVARWSFKRGLKYHDLLRIKHTNKKSTATATSSSKLSTHTDACISRHGSGTCLDFSSKNSSVYVVGTEDGMLYKCSCSHSEQYLQSYYGHSGPVHQVRWSPFASNIFISASADWTIKLWDDAKSFPEFTLQSGCHQVSDVCWSPINSTVFASTTSSGRLEVWDLSVSTLKPAVSSDAFNEKLTCLSFANTSTIIAVGGQSGTVGVFRVPGVNVPNCSDGIRLRVALSTNF